MQMNMYMAREKIKKNFKEFEGMSFDEIAFEVGINPELITSKLSIVKLVNTLFAYKGYDWKSLKDEEFINEISLKTIRLNSNGKPAESMSFERIDFMGIIKENWESSKLRKKFNETTFLFVVFQYEENRPKESKHLIFKGLKLWKMPLSILDTEVKRVWTLTKEVISNGIQIKEVKFGKGVRTSNNLPGIKDSRVTHIRPKARDANDKVELPCGQFIVKQAYWLNSEYIQDVLFDMPDVERKSHVSILQENLLEGKELDVLKYKLKDSVYTIEGFYEKANQHLSTFTHLHMNDSNLSKLGYKITPQYIVSQQIVDIDHYFEDVIFKEDYFVKSKTAVFESQYFKRKIESLENAFRIFEIEEGTYITKRKLMQADINEEMFVDYKKTVENHVSSDEFFTFKSLEASGFTHELVDYGFEALFYENLLRLPGRLRSLRIANQYVFSKTVRNMKITDFIKHFLGRDKSVSVEDLLDAINNSYYLNVDYDYLVTMIKASNLFYSEDMKKVYLDKETYYSEVYD